MPTITKTLTFDYPGEFSDMGLSSGLTLYHTPTLGNPTGGGLYFYTMSPGLQNEVAHIAAATTWSALGVPGTATVTHAECLSADTKVSLSGATHTFKVRIVDGATESVNVCGADLLSTTADSTSWTTSSGTGQQAVGGSYQSPTCSIQLHLDYTINNGILGPPTNYYIDNVVLIITYTEGAGGGGGEPPASFEPSVPGGGGEGTITDCDVEESAPFANDGGPTAWLLGDRYFCRLYNEVFCYDMDAGGWTITGWPFYAAVSCHPWAPDPTVPETLVGICVTQPNWSRTESYLALTAPDVVRSEAGSSAILVSGWTKRIVFRPFDAEGEPRAHPKRALRLTVFGDYENASRTVEAGTQIGLVTLTTDSGYSETYPIYAGQQTGGVMRYSPLGTICVQEFTPACVSNLFEVTLECTCECMVVRNIKLEYVPLG